MPRLYLTTLRIHYRRVPIYTSSATIFFDHNPKGGKSAAGANPLTFFRDYDAQGKVLAKERDELRQEAIKLGLVDRIAPTNAASQVL
jgi:hypothetical protein